MPTTSADRLRLLRRVPRIPLLLTALILLSAVFAVPAIRDAATLRPVEEARLDIPALYLALSPLFDTLDTLTLLSVRQHVALLVSALALFVLWRHWPRRRMEGTPPRRGLGARIAITIGGMIALLLGIAALYAFGALVPRPMAQLLVENPNVVIVDVHAHTMRSHDGRPGWTAEKVREWQRKAGFHAAYISDHRTVEGALEGWANNPPLSGQGTVLLPAIEVVYNREHVNILDYHRTFRGLTDDRMRDMDTTALRMASIIPSREPVIVHTVPGDLHEITPHDGPQTPGVRAIEIVDGAPRGLGQTRRQREQIVKLADSLRLSLVAGSDNHGWGSTAPAWTLFHIPNWRSMPPGDLSDALQRAIRGAGRAATKVVERRVADAGNSVLQLAFALPITFWRMLTTLGTEQRVMWLVWIWALAVLGRLLRGRRETGATRAA